MPNVQNVGFVPSNYAAEQGEIDRRKQMAALLQQQALQGGQGGTQVVGGFAVPQSPLGPLAQALQGLAAGGAQRKVTAQEQALADKSRSDLASVLQGAFGRPEIAQPPAELGGGPGAPAQAPADPQTQARLLMGHPQTQPMAMQMMQQQAQQAQLDALLARVGLGTQGAPAAAPGVAPGTASATGAPWAQAPQGGPQQAGGLDPRVAALRGSNIPGAKEIGAALQTSNEAHGAVQYDQQGRAFVVTKGGQTRYLPGVGQPAATPLERGKFDIDAGRYSFETGLPRPSLQAPGAQPAPGPAAPRPQTQPAPAANVPPGLTPKAQAELAKKRAEEMPEARKAVDLQVQDLDRLTTLATEIKDHPGLGRATGTVGAMPSIPGGQAAQADALITSLKAQISGMKLQAMRNASKTGGAVGNVTEKEWPRLENMITALDPVKMGRETFQKKLDEFVVEVGKVKKTMDDAFTNEYGKPNAGRRVNFKDLP